MSVSESASVVKQSGNRVTIEVEIQLGGSLFDMEKAILDACNSVGCAATTEALSRFD